MDDEIIGPRLRGVACANNFLAAMILRRLVRLRCRGPQDVLRIHMTKLAGKNVVILGATGSVGATIARRVVAEGARTLAVARGRSALDQLAKDVPGLEILPVDAAHEDAPAVVFGAMAPDVLVVCGGARPPAVPLHEMTWSQFAVNWESDVKMSFQFCKAALRRPLPEGSTVILISSGAALGGSPISGGYAGAKRTQMFIANYSEKESNRLHLGIRFIALAPSMIMPETGLGRFAAEGYAKYLGVPAADFISGMKTRLSPEDVARAVVDLASHPTARTGSMFSVSHEGIAAVP
jgi:NAD(P)-dependent dehydrogenase (short-subunit alcohol dehydrogenase family)